MINYLNISDHTRIAVNIAKAYALESKNPKVGASHLLKALVHKKTGLHPFLNSFQKDALYISEWSEVMMLKCPVQANLIHSELTADEKLIDVFDEAEKNRLKMGLDLIHPVCLLAALVKPDCAYTSEQLKSIFIFEDEIWNAYLKDISNNSIFLNKKTSEINLDDSSVFKHNPGSLHLYCIDKNAQFKENKKDPVIGRDKELNAMFEILGRRNKPNVLLIGDPGVGKSTLIDGFVEKINNKEVPSLFKSCIIFELEIHSLLAGTSYKGEIEDRLKNVIKDLKKFDRAILFIDEIHSIIDSKGPLGSGVANLLKPEMVRGELTIIGTSTQDEYRKFIEIDAAFNRRFEILIIKEPDLITTAKIIQALLPSYEEYHGINVDQKIIPEIARLAKRYLKDKCLPDSAIDLLDRTLSAVNVMNDTSAAIALDIERRFKLLLSIHPVNPDFLLSELKWLYKLLENSVSPILTRQSEDLKDIFLEDDFLIVKQELEHAIKKIISLSAILKTEITIDDISTIVALKTGIPVGKIKNHEKNKLLNIDSALKKRVIGQDYAIQVLSDTIVESRSGIIKTGQPIGSFFFLGPTGTGKTELAKAVAEFLFNDEKAMIRFDMSEFKEEHSAALLYGAPPGYVGYEDGGMLVNKIRENPYSVVLFDEIEKAHHSVFDIFLQIMDEGVLHDKLGKEGDFSNAIIIFTSNICSDWITEQFYKNSRPTSASLMDRMGDNFRPEFLGRVSEIIPFAPIEMENVVRIFEIQIKYLSESLYAQGVVLIINEDAKKRIATLGFTPKYGARQLSTVIRNKLRRPLSKMLISGELPKGSIVTVNLNEKDELIFDIQNAVSEILNELVVEQ